MGNYVYKTTTNQKPNSKHDVLGHLMPARIFSFVVVDEPGAEGFLVRRCYGNIDAKYLKALGLSEEGNRREVFPEKYGLWGRNTASNATIAQHVMAHKKITSYASASSEFPDGAWRLANEEQKIVYVDIAAIKRSGGRIITGKEIIAALNEYLKKNPHDKGQIEKIRHYSEDLDKEVLIQPNPMVPPEGVFTPKGLAVARGAIKAARVVRVLSIAFTAYDLKVATDESVKVKSIRPLEKEAVRQIGGWGGAVAGAQIGAEMGTLVGIETGPGAIVTGLIGGLIFGAIGYFDGNAIADKIPDAP